MEEDSWDNDGCQNSNSIVSQLQEQYAISQSIQELSHTPSLSSQQYSIQQSLGVYSDQPPSSYQQSSINQQSHPSEMLDYARIQQEILIDEEIEEGWQQQSEYQKELEIERQMYGRYKKKFEKPISKTKNEFNRVTSIHKKNSLKKIKLEPQSIKQNCQKYDKMFKKNQQNKNEIKSSQNSTKKQIIFFQLEKQIIQEKLRANQKVIQFCGVPVYFPYQPYQVQLKFMESIIKALENNQYALLQSPTGTGKTLCLLCSVLSWLNKNRKERVRVIYTSRTHSQLGQVQRQLQKTCFRPTMCYFGSRDQFCIRKEYQSLFGGDLMESCIKAVKAQIKLMKTPPKQEDKIQNLKTLACPYYQSQEISLNLLQKYSNQIVTQQFIRSEGQKKCFCPYYYSYQVKENVDLIFMPYNYITDASLLNLFQNVVQNSILIFDEAHNVPQVACKGRSYQITNQTFDNVMIELNKLNMDNNISSSLKQVSYLYQATIKNLQKTFKVLRQEIEKVVNKKYNTLFQNIRQLTNLEQQNGLQEIMNTEEMKITIYNWFGFTKLSVEEWARIPIHKKIEIHLLAQSNITKIVRDVKELIDALKQTQDGSFQHIDKLNNFIQKAGQLISQSMDSLQKMQDWESIEANHFRLLIKVNIKNMKNNKFNFEVELTCLTPSLTFARLCKMNPLSIILTSGTLAPVDAWERQLKISFPVQLVGKHVIDPSQLHLAIVRKSYRNKSLFDFSYKGLQKSVSIIEDLVQTIAYFAGVIPSGILVIFPNYKLIESFKKKMQENQELHNQLLKKKALYFGDKNNTSIILSYKKSAMSKKGAILFCVCRGTVSEGIDLVDELCRAVILVGVPYPNYKDPIVQEKMSYYDKLSKERKAKQQITLNGDGWYTLNTMRVVNQSIGRVIRHINDYGMIFLFDYRYDSQKLQSKLPLWAKESIAIYEDFSKVEKKVTAFYQQMKKKFPTSEKQQQENQSISQSNTPIKQVPKKIIKVTKVKKNEKDQTEPNAFQIMMGEARKNNKNNNDKTKIKQFNFC